MASKTNFYNNNNITSSTGRYVNDSSNLSHKDSAYNGAGSGGGGGATDCANNCDINSKLFNYDYNNSKMASNYNIKNNNNNNNNCSTKCGNTSSNNNEKDYLTQIKILAQQDYLINELADKAFRRRSTATENISKNSCTVNDTPRNFNDACKKQNGFTKTNSGNGTVNGCINYANLVGSIESNPKGNQIGNHGKRHSMNLENYMPMSSSKDSNNSSTHSNPKSNDKVLTFAYYSNANYDRVKSKERKSSQSKDKFNKYASLNENRANELKLLNSQYAGYSDKKKSQQTNNTERYTPFEQSLIANQKDAHYVQNIISKLKDIPLKDLQMDKVTNNQVTVTSVAGIKNRTGTLENLSQPSKADTKNNYNCFSYNNCNTSNSTGNTSNACSTLNSSSKNTTVNPINRRQSIIDTSQSNPSDKTFKTASSKEGLTRRPPTSMSNCQTAGTDTSCQYISNDCKNLSNYCTEKKEQHSQPVTLKVNIRNDNQDLKRQKYKSMCIETGEYETDKTNNSCNMNKNNFYIASSAGDLIFSNTANNQTKILDPRQKTNSIISSKNVNEDSTSGRKSKSTLENTANKYDCYNNNNSSKPVTTSCVNSTISINTYSGMPNDKVYIHAENNIEFMLNKKKASDTNNCCNKDSYVNGTGEINARKANSKTNVKNDEVIGEKRNSILSNYTINPTSDTNKSCPTPCYTGSTDTKSQYENPPACFNLNNNSNKDSVRSKNGRTSTTHYKSISELISDLDFNREPPSFSEATNTFNKNKLIDTKKLNTNYENLTTSNSKTDKPNQKPISNSTSSNTTSTNPLKQYQYFDFKDNDNVEEIEKAASFGNNSNDSLESNSYRTDYNDSKNTSASNQKSSVDTKPIDYSSNTAKVISNYTNNITLLNVNSKPTAGPIKQEIQQNKPKSDSTASVTYTPLKYNNIDKHLAILNQHGYVANSDLLNAEKKEKNLIDQLKFMPNNYTPKRKGTESILSQNFSIKTDNQDPLEEPSTARVAQNGSLRKLATPPPLPHIIDPKNKTVPKAGTKSEINTKLSNPIINNNNNNKKTDSPHSKSITSTLRDGKIEKPIRVNQGLPPPPPTILNRQSMNPSQLSYFSYYTNDPAFYETKSTKSKVRNDSGAMIDPRFSSKITNHDYSHNDDYFVNELNNLILNSSLNKNSKLDQNNQNSSISYNSNSTSTSHNTTTTSNFNNKNSYQDNGKSTVSSRSYGTSRTSKRDERDEKIPVVTTNLPQLDKIDYIFKANDDRLLTSKSPFPEEAKNRQRNGAGSKSSIQPERFNNNNNKNQRSSNQDKKQEYNDNSIPWYTKESKNTKNFYENYSRENDRRKREGNGFLMLLPGIAIPIDTDAGDSDDASSTNSI